MANYSKQKEIVLNILKNSKVHPTAEEVFVSARQIEPNISRGTVYRNLDVLCKTGAVKKLSMASGGDRYDYMSWEHSHAVCSCCGKVFDFVCDIDFESLRKSVKSQTKLEIDSSHIIVSGVCENCRNKIKED